MKELIHLRRDVLRGKTSMEDATMEACRVCMTDEDMHSYKYLVDSNIITEHDFWRHRLESCTRALQKIVNTDSRLVWEVARDIITTYDSKGQNIRITVHFMALACIDVEGLEQRWKKIPREDSRAHAVFWARELCNLIRVIHASEVQNKPYAWIVPSDVHMDRTQ